jgi:hypothetical protein
VSADRFQWRAGGSFRIGLHAEFRVQPFLLADLQAVPAAARAMFSFPVRQIRVKIAIHRSANGLRA